MKRRFFAPTLSEKGGEVVLGPEGSHHARVLRLHPGDPICLFDGRGASAEGHVVEVGYRGVVCHMGHPSAEALSKIPQVILIQVLPKGPKLDLIVRMATEIGVRAIHLATSQRSVPRGAVFPKARHERLKRLARESARQAGRTVTPEVYAPEPLAVVAARASQDSLRVVFSGGAAKRLPPQAAAKVAWGVIGPEGGLTELELEALCGLGYEHVRLGDTVLRVDTAATVASAFLLDRLFSSSHPSR